MRLLCLQIWLSIQWNSCLMPQTVPKLLESTAMRRLQGSILLEYKDLSYSLLSCICRNNKEPVTMPDMERFNATRLGLFSKQKISISLSHKLYTHILNRSPFPRSHIRLRIRFDTHRRRVSAALGSTRSGVVRSWYASRGKI